MSQICQHIAEGLAFVHSKRILHRDLVRLFVVSEADMPGASSFRLTTVIFDSLTLSTQACRNVLIADDGSAKLAE
jgi:serine/threonine protein kinase